ncbi:hypothetical protein A374_15678 [Fictibacillus macauensis ZFHKF-1]|uniref:Uncharacterized protein n=1 Tax=Fictibacillus macauensis ZFHKF-1 TaxID=1196324 RepID=I8UBC1_9BACL|nr:hypothetical protein [Fictibacillus macauensis]EIT84240.1 hypothetical protein A374_15678 [Fictibacillus macauensis ZFHKF-1]
MKKKTIYLLVAFLLLASIGTYFYYDLHHMSGESNNGIWEVSLRKTTNESEPKGWYGTVKQTNKDRYQVKKVIFKKKNHVLTYLDTFKNDTDLDDLKTVLYPFEAEFWVGDIQKGEEYRVEIFYKEGHEKKSTSFSFK